MNSTTTNGLPVFAIASISSCCWPGRSMSEREAASPLISRDSPSASTTWSAALALATASAKPSVGEHSLSGVFCRRLEVVDLAALAVRRAGRLGLDAVEDADGVGVLALAPPRAEHVVLVVAERADHRGLLLRVERQRRVAAVLLSFFSSTIERDAAVRAAARSAAVTNDFGSVALAWST